MNGFNELTPMQKKINEFTNNVLPVYGYTVEERDHAILTLIDIREKTKTVELDDIYTYLCMVEGKVFETDEQFDLYIEMLADTQELANIAGITLFWGLELAYEDAQKQAKEDIEDWQAGQDCSFYANA